MKKDWMSCDGGGGQVPLSTKDPGLRLTRKGFVVGTALGALGLLGAETALSQVMVKAPSRGKTLVVLFLRGGADGLNVIAPYADEDYYRLRPSLGIPSPQKNGNGKNNLSDLDGFFGLHPSMSPLKSAFDDGELAILHACGSFDHSHSHFDAMSAMERGQANANGPQSDGWLARLLGSSTVKNASPLRAIAFGDTLPDSLKGASGAVAMESVSDYKISSSEDSADSLQAFLESAYQGEGGDLGSAGIQTMKAVNRLSTLDTRSYSPEKGAVYPKSSLGDGLKQVAMLIKSEIGLEIACLDKGGWDTHVAQGSTQGWQANLMNDLSASIAAFRLDMASRNKDVSLVVMTEFGRRAYENSGLGTDHGSASFMLALGGHVKGGKVYRNWPGLGPDQLYGPGDLKVTTDYRNVLCEVAEATLNGFNRRPVFPDLSYAPIGIMK